MTYLFTWATCLCFEGMFSTWLAFTQTIFLAGERQTDIYLYCFRARKPL